MRLRYRLVARRTLCSAWGFLARYSATPAWCCQVTYLHGSESEFPTLIAQLKFLKLTQ